ncbi:MAG: ribosome-associated translation inhibitor RaiA [Pyrinomonadaceae bacterium]|nr:ribosome-associated translation inhibitor RaiA [Pyrinomonadaceae bacterium]
MGIKIDFTGRHIEVTEALKKHAAGQFERLGPLFDSKPPTANVTIEVERGRHRSEIIVHWRNETLNATSIDADMYQSLSKSVAKIEKQARKLKDKVIDKSHRARRATPGSARESAPPTRRPKIVVSKMKAQKPITAQEAAMVLDEKKEGFMLFRDSDGGEISLIFKRPDGNYGLVQP